MCRSAGIRTESVQLITSNVNQQTCVLLVHSLLAKSLEMFPEVRADFLAAPTISKVSSSSYRLESEL